MDGQQPESRHTARDADILRAIGAFLVLNFWFAKGLPILAGANHDVVWLVIFVVLGLLPAGKVAGLDDGLSDRFPFLR